MSEKYIEGLWYLPHLMRSSLLGIRIKSFLESLGHEIHDTPVPRMSYASKTGGKNLYVVVSPDPAFSKDLIDVVPEMEGIVAVVSGFQPKDNALQFDYLYDGKSVDAGYLSFKSGKPHWSHKAKTSTSNIADLWRRTCNQVNL